MSTAMPENGNASAGTEAANQKSREQPKAYAFDMGTARVKRFLTDVQLKLIIEECDVLYRLAFAASDVLKIHITDSQRASLREGIGKDRARLLEINSTLFDNDSFVVGRCQMCYKKRNTHSRFGLMFCEGCENGRWYGAARLLYLRANAEENKAISSPDAGVAQ